MDFEVLLSIKTLIEKSYYFTVLLETLSIPDSLPLYGTLNGKSLKNVKTI